MPDQKPVGADFLKVVEAASDDAGVITDEQREAWGTTYPQTLDNLGMVLSLLYRAGCCGWGCRGSDHQREWLIGRAVNQGMASYRLLRSAFYDESLMITRGLGEIANLLWLFREPGEFEHWRSAERADRMKHFSPSAVRKRLRTKLQTSSPISDDRYRQLCEVGSHPVPWTGPNLFSGGTRPALGHLVQPAGLLMAMNELSLAVAVASVPVGSFLELPDEVKTELARAGRQLVESVGNVTIDKYDELTAEQLKAAATTSRHRVTN